MAWDPCCYSKFKSERAQPFEDLIKIVEARQGMRVIDLGCGTGELTQRLAELLPNCDVLGIDSSDEMLAEAQKLKRPGLQFERKTIEETSGSWDLVFSNAALQWVSDHQRLLPRLFSMVRAGGQLAVQLPSNFNHPSQVILREIAATEPFRQSPDGAGRSPSALMVERYADLLNECGADRIVAFDKIYPHRLIDADAVLEWMRGTALVFYKERLRAEVYSELVERFRVRLRELWPRGPIFYGFKRTLFAATRPLSDA